MRASERAWKGQKSDSGWIQVTSTVTGTWGIQYRVLNGYVTVMISGSVTTPSGSTQTFATGVIPTALCPPVAARGAGSFNGISGLVSVSNTGDVTGRQDTGSSQSTISGTITWPIT